MAKRRNFLTEEIDDICNSYKNGTSRSVLLKKYKCTDKVIVRILEENNVTIRRMKNPSGGKRKYNINDNYFNINHQSHNSAYILGILASDGCVASTQNQIYIELQRKDKELLTQINEELQNERPVKDYINHSKNYENSKLYFFSKQIKKDLKQYNIIPNKTKNSINLSFIEKIKPEYQIDYIRGHFDGDGCIKWVNGTITWQIDSTSIQTLIDIQKILQSYNIDAKIQKKKDIVNLQLYRLYFYGYNNAITLYKRFYEFPPTVTLRMNRKQKHFTELLLKYKTHESTSLTFS